VRPRGTRSEGRLRCPDQVRAYTYAGKQQRQLFNFTNSVLLAA
jgi:hypothetical protein